MWGENMAGGIVTLHLFFNVLTVPLVYLLGTGDWNDSPKSPGYVVVKITVDTDWHFICPFSPAVVVFSFV